MTVGQLSAAAALFVEISALQHASASRCASHGADHNFAYQRSFALMEGLARMADLLDAQWAKDHLGKNGRVRMSAPRGAPPRFCDDFVPYLPQQQ